MAQEFFKYEGRCGKGFQRVLKEERRADALARNAKTPHPRTRAHHLGRCICVTDPQPVA